MQDLNKLAKYKTNQVLVNYTRPNMLQAYSIIMQARTVKVSPVFPFVVVNVNRRESKKEGWATNIHMVSSPAMILADMSSSWCVLAKLPVGHLELPVGAYQEKEQ